MAELTLEPYAARLRWHLPSAVASHEWEAILSEYLEALARHCDEAAPCVIGHIKGLALFPNGDYLRISIVSPARPADVEGNASEHYAELTLTLNVLVYGLSRDVLERLAQETAADVASRWGGMVTVGPSPA